MLPLIQALFVLLLVAVPSLVFGSPTIPANSEIRLAYIDPGTGSFLIQALIAAIAGIAVTGRIYWSKIKTMLGMATATDDEDLDADDE